jgi:DNA adenine methylase
MADVLLQIRRLNGLADRSVAEPYAGGAGAALTLLFLEETTEIFINDADPAIHDFWWSLISRPDAFMKVLARTRVNMAEWKRQRDVYRSAVSISRLRRGFSAFYLNRCNRSGIIIDGGPIGGIQQTGKWNLKARFNKAELRRRCEKIAEFRSRIHVSSQDGIRFIATVDPGSTFLFIDPPYFEKGHTLYLNTLSAKYHRQLASKLRSMNEAAWVLTYDDCPQVRKMYRGWAGIRPFLLRYAAAERRNGLEVLITPKWMRLPTTQSSGAVLWPSR